MDPYWIGQPMRSPGEHTGFLESLGPYFHTGLGHVGSASFSEKAGNAYSISPKHGFVIR